MAPPNIRPDPVRTALAPCRRLLASAFLFSAAMSILALTTSFYMLQVYDRVLTSRSNETLLLLTIIAVVALAVFSVLDSLRMRLLARTGMQAAEALAAPVLRAMVATASQNGGSTLRSGLRDVETLRAFIASAGVAALLDAPFIIVYLIVLGLLSLYFVLVVLIGGAILVALALANQRATGAQLTRSLQLTARAHEFAEDGLGNADVLEGMGMSRAFVAHWRTNWLDALRTGTVAADRDSRFSSASRGARLLIQVALLGTGALLILDFKATGGIMIGASIIGARALAPIESTVALWKNAIAARLSWNRLSALLRGAPRREEGMALPAPAGRLQLSAVQYAPPGARRAIVSNLSFEVAPGEMLGIVGPSASGKSTLLRLMTGAWPCSSGSVRLDGADIYSWPRGDLSRHIGYLPQDVELFAGTVRANIARLDEGDPQVVVRAAMRAGAHEMILGLPRDYNTEVGSNGHGLSGGQSQRVGIARALYGEPRYVVLDEPNANLDGEGEARLLATIADLKATGVTTVIVAHRPSILQSVDKILVLRANGTLDMFGPRDEVLQLLAKRRPAPPINVVPLASGDTPGGRG